MKTLGDYHDLYLLSDVLLLADVITAFREMCINHYNIDPLHSYTAPGFAWQAALKMTDVNLDLLSDNDMYLFCEQGIRGGVSVISQRFAESNALENNDSEKNHLIYLDL